MHFTRAALILGLAWVASAEQPLPDEARLKSSPVLRHLKPNPTPAAPRNPPEAILTKMFVPAGFKVELIAAEPDLHQPVAFAFDDRGRIWVAEAYSYPQKQPAGKGLDQIIIFEDSDGDGRFESHKTFITGLNLVSGFEIGHGGIWVGAAPELLFIPDRDQDDKPDGPPEVLLEGFGFQDTHECLNSFLWGPDGWLYGNQGVFNYSKIGIPGAADTERVELRAGIWRYHPVRRQFEIFAEGGSNQWGLDYDERGQIFMTHCRSYWGRGGTTHVIQGGHFWNQANANYPPFIVPAPPADFPGFRNYLLASARYDHGAGGAGPPGSDAIYGGHSHVGTMIYLGDNWPDTFRGHLFTHNLHGHQINQQVNRRVGSGFDTVHAGRDQFFCSDPSYVAVDLQYGPDGAVYFIDWSDQQHCHNPNTERWDRANGRLYRMQFEATYRPANVNLGKLDDRKLVQMQEHKNDWFARTARRLLHERAQTRAIEAEAASAVERMAEQHPDPLQRLKALWTLQAIGRFSAARTQRALADPDEYVRGWAVQLCAENRRVPNELLSQFEAMAKTDPSPVVRLFLASVPQRVPEKVAWQLLEALCQHGEDREDRNLPALIWHGIGRLQPRNLDRSFDIAEHTLLPSITDWVYWYASASEGDGLNRVLAKLAQLSGEDQRRMLAGMLLAVEARASVPPPQNWKQIGPGLCSNKDVRVSRAAERLAAAFGDDSVFPRLRKTLADQNASEDNRRHAFEVLRRARDASSVPLFIGLLSEEKFRLAAIQLLARFDAPEIAVALMNGFAKYNVEERAAALNALTGRASFALALLDAVADRRIERDQLTAFHIRQLMQLGDPTVSKRVAATWGRVNPSPAEKQELIARLEHVFKEAPLWAYESNAGREHFRKLCAQCHRLGNEGVRLGPELTGAGRNGIRYFLENIIDPDAVIGTDYQMTTLETTKGDVLSGLLIREAADGVTIRTTVEEVVVPKTDIARRAISQKSLMPEGLLEPLGNREQIELLKFLVGN